MRYFKCCILLIYAVFSVSCANSGSSPVFPQSSNQTQQIKSSDTSSRHLWGYWNVLIDPASGNVELTPLRNAEFTCNVTMFLQPPAGKISNLGIKITDLSQFNDQGLLDVEVTLTHPFPGLTMYTGFDVLGVFINHGDTKSNYDSGVYYARTTNVARLLNADGYTRWYNPTEFTAKGLLGFTEGALGNKGMGFTATINPYKYFANGLGVNDSLTEFLHDPNTISNRCLFSSTASNKRLYKLQFPIVGGAPYLTFQYAVIASWEPPIAQPPQNIPGDFPLSANIREPFLLSLEDNKSTLYYANGVGGGTVKIKAELFDWGASVNSAGILGEFSKIVIESPNANIPGGYAAFTPSDFAPFIKPSTAISSVAELEFDGVVPSSNDDVEFLITVVASDGETYSQGFGVPVPDAPLASYFRFTLPVSDTPIIEEPCGDFSVISANPPSATSGESYPNFQVNGSNFVAGPNLAVDIVNGAVIVKSATSVTLVNSNLITCSFQMCGVLPGNYQLRVTNGCEPVSYASIPYTINPDPLKNIPLRGGMLIRDLSINEKTGEPYVQFDDGQLWIYTPDYSSGEYRITNTALNRIAAQNELYVESLGVNVMEATMIGTNDYRAYVYWRAPNSFNIPASYSGPMIDVMAAHNNYRHYYVQNCSTYLGMIRRNIGFPNSGFLSNYSGVGTGPGVVNMAAVKGVDTSKFLSEFVFPQAAWFYLLEGAPDYSVERLAYMGQSSNHYFNAGGTFLSGPGDGNMQLNNPLDIASDGASRVIILDILSTGQPILKIYDYNMNFIGSVGNSVTISGTPLRVDTDDGDNEIHVAHTNGVSIFRPCELPY